ncbi:MAG: DNA polymerase I [Tissierellia bacterium]|nr:DNA polymerase I [Tissierellia bacterium]
MDKYLIIDGSSILFRAFYALPPMSTKTGKSTNAVLGFLNILLKALELIEPTGVGVCFDLSGPTFRSDIYVDYKANRSLAPEELSEQFGYIKEILTAFKVNYYELPGYEADDIAGTLAKELSNAENEVYLLTGDKDYLQLVNESTKLLYTKTGISELGIYDVETIYSEMGITPKQIVDLKALMGDKSDNIPGIPGVGEKTALKLIQEFGSIENLYENIGNLKINKTNQKIIDNKDIAFISKELSKIDTDVSLDFKISDLKLVKYDDILLGEILNKYELNSIMKRLEVQDESTLLEEVSKKNIKNNEPIEEIVNTVKENGYFAFKFLTSNKPYLGGKIFKVGLLCNNTYFINDIEDGNIEFLNDLFKDEKIVKIGYEIKEDILHIISQNMELKNYLGDVVIAEYLLNPTDSDYSMDRIAAKYGITLEANFPDKKALKDNSEHWENKVQDDYLLSILELIDEVHNLQLSKLEDYDMLKLYNEIELPLVYVLADMEYTGVQVDKDALIEIGKNLELELEGLVENIYIQAGVEFNINSTKQLAEILFEKLKLPVIKKTKTGYSTDIEVLEKLEDKHEIISYLIRYRTISKLKNTYVNGMMVYINEMTGGRIHSNFNQTVAATGRLSSQDPNLQNIPVRTEEGRQLRKIFTKTNENNKLIDADYSQIELRLLADISEDANMIESFINKEDIHTTTAAKVFDVSMNEVTPLLRSRAKAVNFGIVYGISDYGLSQDLNISRNEAKSYIENYLNRFSGVGKYMDEIVKQAKKDGFVETKFGRKRFLPELSSRNRNIRNFGERIALNMPIQGTAADIIKIAMVNVYFKLKESGYKSKLILQIHDELIVEAFIDEMEEVKKILVEEMENAVKLKVPLTVDIDIGDSWYETK